MPAPPRILVAGDSALVVEYGRAIDAHVNARVRRLEACLGADAAARHPRDRADLPVADWSTTIRSSCPARRSSACCWTPTRGSALRIAAAPRTVALPVAYGGAFGPDLADVAAHARPRGARGRRDSRGRRLPRLHARLHAGLSVSRRPVAAPRDARGSRRRAPPCRRARSALPASRPASIRPRARAGGGSSGGRPCACSTRRSRRRRSSRPATRCGSSPIDPVEFDEVARAGRGGTATRPSIRSGG